MKLSSLVLILLLAAPALKAQSAPGATGGDDRWEVYGGGAAVVNTGGYYTYGWTGSVSEYPYARHPWLGGAIEGGGAYDSSSSGSSGFSVQTSTSTHTVLGGPVIALAQGRLRPFAHLLFGTTVQHNSVTFVLAGTSSTVEATTNSFAMAAGGGVDLRLANHLAVRTQCEWLRSGSSNATNSIRPSAGLVFHF